MSTLTIRLPDEKYTRLKALAKQRNVSVNQLMNDLTSELLASFDTEARFRARAARGDRQAGLEALDRIEESL